MATTFPQAASRVAAQTRADRRAAAWELAGAAAIGVALLLFVIGTAWDIQWHTNVGRDRVLTPPHQLMLGGIVLAGVASLVVILRESYGAWRGQAGGHGARVRLLRLFHAPVGLAVAGFGALLAAIAFPLDDYWHTLYGIDVTLWAPFHVMIVMSMVLAGLGGLYVIAAALPDAAEARAGWPLVAGFAAQLALLLATLLLLLPQANVAEGLVRVAGYDLVLYPVLVATTLPLALVSVLWVTQRPGAATLLALVFLLLRAALFGLIPWVMDVTVAAEGLVERAGATDIVITPFAYPGAILLAALLIDGGYALARRRGRGHSALLGLGALSAVLVTFIDRPWAETMTRWYYPELDTSAALLHSLPLTIAGALVGVGLAGVISRGLRAARY